MKRLKKALCCLLVLLMAGSVCLLPGWAAPQQATTDATYFNSATLAAADPAVMYDPVSGYYYAYSTDGSVGQTYFGIYRSADMVTWERTGGAIPRNTPQWGNSWFWAPECYYNENTGWYFLFYAARMEKGPKAEAHFGFSNFEEACKVGVAVSRSPEGPFLNIGAQPIDYFPYDPNYDDINLIMPNQNVPPTTLEEGQTAPKGTYLPYIDANVFFDEDGRIFLYFSRNCYRNWVWDPVLEKYLEESNIYCVELTTDWWNDPLAQTVPTVTAEYKNANLSPEDAEGVRKDGFVPVINYAMEPQEWENAHINRVPTNRRWAEGSTTIKYYFDKDGDGTKEPYYYMFYSCNNWENEWYGVGYAVSDNPLGPWNKYDLNPILKLNSDMSGTGHGSLMWSPDGKDIFYAYHGRKGTTGARRLFQDRLTIDETKIDADTGLPTISILQSVNDQPVPSGVAPYTVESESAQVRLEPGASVTVPWKVTSATGAALPLFINDNATDRVVATIADPEIATIQATAKSGTVKGVAPGRTTLRLEYQRKQANGSFVSVTNTVDGQAVPAVLEIPVVVSDVSVSEISEVTYVNEAFQLQITTPVEVTGIKLQNESGSFIGLASLSFELLEGKKVWTITTQVGSAGANRVLKVLTRQAGVYQYSYADVLFTTMKRPAEVKSMLFSQRAAEMNQDVLVTIVTNASANRINILNSNGGKMGKVLLSKTTLPGGDIEWVYSISFGSRGINKEYRAFAGIGEDYNLQQFGTDSITIV